MKELFDSLKIFLILAFVTGILYPVLITGLAQTFLRDQANGSLIIRQNRVIGSSLLGQNFTDPKYFTGRQSATTPPYNAAASSGSNLGPLTSKLKESIEQRLKDLQDSGVKNADPLLLTSSASGLDPHISPSAAKCQAARVAKARNMDERSVLDLLERNTKHKQFGFLGEEVVNVLSLNLELDQNQSK